MQRQTEKRRLARAARAAAREAVGEQKKRRGAPLGAQKRRCSKITGGPPAKRSQNQKAAWMRRRLRGKQPPLGMTACARVIHAKAIHAKTVADRAIQSMLVAAAEAEARAQAAETACQQANELAERANQWAAAETRKTSQADKDRWSSFATAAPAKG